MGKKIMIGTMVKNSARWLDSYWNVIKKLDYPKEDLRIVFIYGISIDYTLKKLKAMAKEKIVDIEVYRQQTDEPMRVQGAQAAAVAYQDMQYLLDEEDYFMLFDSDIVDVKPTNLIEELIKVDADIVAPYPYSENYAHFYDNWIFRYKNTRFSPDDPPHRDAIYPVVVDSVGTCFLAKRDTWVGTQIKNPYPNLTFCLEAKRLGADVVACPYLHVIHADIAKLGIKHNPLPQKFGYYPQPGWITSKMELPKYVKDKDQGMEEGLGKLHEELGI